MSIEAKHAYRFGFLKSDKWKAVRLEALAREKGKCQICGEESIYNDAHHIWYPKEIYETTEQHLVVLCRPCHDFIHTMMPECKTQDESEGKANWLKFSNAIMVWRRQKLAIFGSIEGVKVVDPKALREELARLKTELSWYHQSTEMIPKLKVSRTLSQIKQLVDSCLDSAVEKKACVSSDEMQE